MRKLFALLVFIFSASLTAAPPPQAVCSQMTITIQNPSFETPVDLPGIVSDPQGCGNYAHVIPGWVMQPLQGGAGGGVVKWTCQTPPDGSMVAFLGYGERMVQDLGVPAQAGVYTLTVYVANWFFNYTGPYAAAIWVGGFDIPNQGTRYSHQVCSTSGYALYDFKPIPLVCPMPEYIAPNNGFNWPNFNGGDLVISIDGTGWTIMPDKVSLTFAPES